MSLRDPEEAVDFIAKRLKRSWPNWVHAELAQEAVERIECPLRAGVTTSPGVERVGIDAWHAWRTAWRNLDLTDLPGVEVESREIQVRGVRTQVPFTLRVTALDGVLGLLSRFDREAEVAIIVRARQAGIRLQGFDAPVTALALRAVSKLGDHDVDVLMDALAWLRDQHDLSEWTTRQLPVPGMHTKWLTKHESLVRMLAGRDLTQEARPRLSVAHFTYADPDYLAAGMRRHDAWTSGDHHAPAYAPRNVLIVENRDCRLWFPDMTETIVVEGQGKAVAALASIEWLVEAERVIYWGDIDSEGFGILNHFREVLRPYGVRVESLLMDGFAWERYEHLGVNRDRRGDPLKPSSIRLSHLSDPEAECYARVATSGEVAVRRIEQERIPLAEAARELTRLLSPGG